jgi:ribosomal subunit interface protein
MEILIRSPHDVIPAQAEIDLYERFEKLAHLMPGILFCDVVLSHEHKKPHGYGVHAKLSVRGEDLFAKEEGETYLHAARLVIADLENQIRKRKEKLDPHPMPSEESDEEIGG